MRRIGSTDLNNLPGVLAPPRHILEPVFEREGDFSEIFFTKGVLIPGDKFDGREFIGQREIDIEIECSVFLWKGWVQRLFDNACLVSNRKARDDKEAEWNYQKVSI